MHTPDKFRLSTIKSEGNPVSVSWSQVKTKVQNWLNDQSEIYEEGFSLVSSNTLNLALRSILEMERDGIPPPVSISADVNGFVVLEFKRGKLSEFLSIKGDELEEKLEKLEKEDGVEEEVEPVITNFNKEEIND